jgi:co-chaperonin GroES (HSP10)
MRIVAANSYVFVIRDDSQKEVGGLVMPDQSLKPTNVGEIVSIGKLVSDKSIQLKRRAIFSQHSGFSINVDNVEYTVLRDSEIIGFEDNA